MRDRKALLLLAVLAVVAALHAMREVFIPIAIALTASYPLDPPVSWLERRRIPRGLAALAVLLATLAPVGIGGWLLSGQVRLLLDQLPVAARRMVSQLERARETGASALGRVQETAAVLEQGAGQAPAAPAPGLPLGDALWSGSLSTLHLLGNLVMTLFLLYFLLASGDLFRRKLEGLAGWAHETLTAEILQDIHRRISRFLVSLLLANLAVALLTWLALLGLGVRHALLLALLAGALNSIPYFGPALVTGGLALVAAFQFGSLTMALTVSGVSLVITSIEGWWLTPVLMGKAVRMNAVAVFVSLLLWTWIWGVWGTLLAIPMMAMVKTIADHVPELKALRDLLEE